MSARQRLCGHVTCALLLIVLGLADLTFVESSCPKGWITVRVTPSQQTCVKIYVTPQKTFFDSQKFCQSKGGYLYRDTTEMLHKSMVSYVHNLHFRVRLLWIGLTDLNKDNGPWAWLGGPILTSYTKWGRTARQPRNQNVKGKQDCVVVRTTERSDFHWFSSPKCSSSKRSYICQRDYKAPSVRPTAPLPVGCAKGWTMYTDQTTCLRLFIKPQSWQNARKYCKRFGGDLVRIIDTPMNNFVTAFSNKVQKYIWIGLSDYYRRHQFAWLDDKSKAPWTHWNKREPGNRGSAESCGQVRWDSYWVGNICSKHYPFICQVSAVSQPRMTTHRPVDPNCGAGWEQDPTSVHCFQFNADRRSWLDAQTQCRQGGGELASIATPRQQSYLTGRSVSLTSGLFLWTGGNDRATERGWSWSDAKPFPFFNWNKGQPKNKEKKDCIAMMRPTGRWSVVDCTDKYGYICKKVGKKKPTTPKPTTPPKHLGKNQAWGCPDHWAKYRGSCYQIHQAPTGFTWDQAKTFCHKAGGSLAAVSDDEENRFIFSLLGAVQGKYRTDMWLGLTDATMENNFYWYDGSPMTYTNWYPGQPDNYRNEDCVRMSTRLFTNWYPGQPDNSRNEDSVRMSTRNGGWIDFQCQSTVLKVSVCKQNAKVYTKNTSENQNGCHTGMFGYEDTCYGYFGGPANFSQAQKNCQSFKGNLATLDDSYVQAFVASELVHFQQDAPYFWIGLRNTPATHSMYAWVSGNTHLGNPLWDKRHTGKESNTCIALQAKKPPGVWINFDCTKKFSFICEMNRPGYTTSKPVMTTHMTLNLGCPLGWYTFNNRCYKVYFLPQTTWSKARDYCNNVANGGTLATIDSQTLSDGIRNYMEPQNPIFDVFWIGLNDRDSEATYEWPDGTPYIWNLFAPNQPDDDLHREDCVQWKYSENKWFDTYCYTTASFICQMPKGEILQTQPPLPTIGPSGGFCGNTSWTLYHGQCYFLSPLEVSASWFNARDTCRQMGAGLVSIDNADENAYVTSILRSDDDTNFWIGLTDLSEYTWTWTDGTPFVYRSWADHGADDGDGDYRCVQINQVGLWTTAHCQDSMGYVCKKDPTNSPRPPTTQQTIFTGSCPPQFVSHPAVDRCYFVGGKDSKDQVPWATAKEQCTHAWPKARLASIGSKVAQDFVTTLLAGVDGSVWIGMDSSRRWVDNQPVTFSHWGQGSDSGPDTNTNCYALSQDPAYGDWIPKFCTENHAYLCEYQRGDDHQKSPANTTGCLSGYQRFRNSCYKYVSDRKSWTQAGQQCQGDNANLMSVTDKYESAVLNVLTDTEQEADLWIGLHYSSTMSVYKWTDGWPVRYTNWGPKNQISAGQVQGCVAYSRDRLWHDDACTHQRPFVCEINLGPPPRQSTQVIVCPPGWMTFLDTACYFMETQYPKTSASAEYDCKLRGGDLVSIHSELEAKYVGRWTLNGDSNAWIGMRKTDNGEFVWTDGSEMEFRNFWAPDEPSDPDSNEHQDCVAALAPDGEWEDIDCDDELSYICKRVATLSTQPPALSQPLKASDDSSNSPMSGGAIAGVVIGVIVFVALAVVGVFFARRRFLVSTRPASSSVTAFDNVAYAVENKGGSNSSA